MQLARQFNVWAIGLNLGLAILLFVTARSPLPLALVWSIAAVLVALPLVLTAMRLQGVRSYDAGFLMSMFGTAMIWAPAFLTAYEYTGPLPELINSLTNVSMFGGVALLLTSVFWPVPLGRNTQGS